VAGQNGRGPVNLFQKHDADHLMRPGRRAERNAQFSLALQIGRKSVRAADCENSVGASLVAPAAEMAGKCGAVDVLAALVESGISAEIAAASSAMRLAASRARLSGIS
jgi:hypothetical protein